MGEFRELAAISGEGLPDGRPFRCGKPRQEVSGAAAELTACMQKRVLTFSSEDLCHSHGRKLVRCPGWGIQTI